MTNGDPDYLPLDPAIVALIADLHRERRRMIRTTWLLGGATILNLIVLGHGIAT